jgi:hypothetical protein
MTLSSRLQSESRRTRDAGFSLVTIHRVTLLNHFCIVTASLYQSAMAADRIRVSPTILGLFKILFPGSPLGLQSCAIEEETTASVA